MKRVLNILILVILFSSCVKDDYFGYSNYGNIKSIVLTNQASDAIISTDSLSVLVEIPGGVDLSEIIIEELTLSSFAEADKKVDDTLDLTSSQEIVVTAEDGTEYIWTITAYVASSTPQLSNNDFNLWYKTASDYYEPGADASSTIWGTGNPGTQLIGSLATIPEDLGDGNLAVHMETLDNGKLAGTFGAPISAGSLFTGVFNSDNLDVSDPEAALDLGTPFVGRPKKVRFKYSYLPGDENTDKKGNVLNYNDACDIYAFLEVKIGDKSQRLATAWFRSDKNQTDLITQEMVFYYGELSDTMPEYMFPEDESFVGEDSVSIILPTHIIFVATSSYDGGNFAGAIGSTLILDDVEMLYDE